MKKNNFIKKRGFTLSEIVVTIAIVGLITALLSSVFYSGWFFTNEGIETIDLTNQLKINYSILVRDFKNSKTATVSDNSMLLVLNNDLEVTYFYSDSEYALYRNNTVIMTNIKELHFESEDQDLLKVNLVLGKNDKDLKFPSEFYIHRRK